MRIRGTRPEFWLSHRIASVSWEARLVLKALESYVDDNGVGVFDYEIIVPTLFPRDYFRSPRETVARVTEAITQLKEAGLVWIYETQDIENPEKTLNAVYISNWDKIQRIDKPQAGRIRRPDGTLSYKESQIRESVASNPETVANVPETVAPVTGEQGNRGTDIYMRSTDVETRNKSDTDPPQPDSPHLDTFDEFWEAYPLKRGKQAARKAYRKALTKKPAPIIIAGAHGYAEAVQGIEKKFIKYPQGWLNDERWDDYLPEVGQHNRVDEFQPFQRPPRPARMPVPNEWKELGDEQKRKYRDAWTQALEETSDRQIAYSKAIETLD